jgi:hypothetical protein
MRRPTEDGVMARTKKGRFLDSAGTAARESKSIDFKERFDPGSDAECLEIIKDIAAMANSGGGLIVIGVRNDGSASGIDVSPVLGMDPATLTDKMFKYTGQQFSGFEIHDLKRQGRQIAAMEIEGVDAPLVFIRPGTYGISPSQQKTAFSRGTIYFRHGAKSEPAVSADLTGFIERRVDQVRRTWLGGIRKVVTAPPGSEVAVYERAASDVEGRPTKVRFTDDPDAPVFGKLDPDKTHPYRQKELLREVNKRLPKGKTINSHDLVCIRGVYKINDQSRPEFAHLPRFGSMQYSEDFVVWLADQYRRNEQFFDEARTRHYEQSRPPRG